MNATPGPVGAWLLEHRFRGDAAQRERSRHRRRERPRRQRRNVCDWRSASRRVPHERESEAVHGYLLCQVGVSRVTIHRVGIPASTAA